MSVTDWIAQSYAQADWWAVFKIVWIDLLLSGDNAMVIALACHNLPPRQRKWGAILGAGAAVALRVALTGVVTHVMSVPYLKFAGGVLLFWVALKLLVDEDEERRVGEAHSLWRAVWIIVVADAVMSLDNVIAVAAAAEGSFALVVFGLIVSIPLVVAGSGLVMWLMDRFPIVIWAGAALLGWLAGGMIVHEGFVAERIGDWPHVELAAEIIGAALVVAIGWLRGRRLERVAGAD
jgi:YjbE family integral membrane protein